MCGICGIIDKNTSKDQRVATVRQMNEAMIHRGPDDHGLYDDGFCTLAMRRLAIIDLSTGKQPMFNEHYGIVFNGEIYNYRSLRAELEQKGYSFRTQSDTEVILKLYEAEGTKMPARLKGMFCFCIYDLRGKTWFFARDRFGEKPLYYFHQGEHLTFASEVKALLENPIIERYLDTSNLSCYLSNTFVPEPETLLKNVYTLPPGECLLFSGGQIKHWSYFTPTYQVDHRLKTVNDCLDFLRPILKTSIQRQMVSDVPIGAFLSGGIDSSTVVANLQALSDQPIKTFTVKFEDAKYDESSIARKVASHLGTKHHEITIANQQFEESILWEIIDHVGLPFPDSSAIPTYFISKEIRQYVKVALSGDGGDELFAGYPFYQWWQKVDQLYRIPTPIRSIAHSLADWFPGLAGLPKIRQLQRGLMATMGTKNEVGARMHVLFTQKELTRLFPRASVTPSRFATFPEGADQWSALQKSLFFRLKYNLPLDMLTKVDRMSMANALEVRAPFLDPDLFEAASKIPAEFLIHKGEGKYIIRKLMKNQLPDSVFNHPKTGFSIPLHRYMNEVFEDLVQKLVTNNQLLKELFDPKEMHKIVKRGLSQKSDGQMSVYRSAHQLWSLLQLGAWIHQFNIGLE